MNSHWDGNIGKELMQTGENLHNVLNVKNKSPMWT